MFLLFRPIRLSLFFLFSSIWGLSSLADRHQDLTETYRKVKTTTHLEKYIAGTTDEAEASALIDVLKRNSRRLFDSSHQYKLYHTLAWKGYYKAIAYHLFPGDSESVHRHLSYSALRNLSDYREIARRILFALNARYSSPSIELRAIRDLYAREKGRWMDEEIEKFSFSLSSLEVEIIHFYNDYYGSRFEAALRRIRPLHLKERIKTSLLQKQLQRDMPSIHDRYYELARYEEYLEMILLPNVDFLKKVDRIKKAIDYVEGYRRNFPDNYLSEEAKSRSLFSRGDHARILAKQPWKKNIYYAVSLLETGRIDDYVDFFLGESKLHALLWIIYQGGTNDFLLHFQNMLDMSSEELEVKNLLVDHPDQAEVLMNLLRKKYALAPDFPALEKESLPSFPPGLKGYYLVSLMEYFLEKDNKAEIDRIYHLYAEQMIPRPWGEKAMYLYGKSLERRNPEKARKVYRDLLIRAPETFYRYHILSYLFSLEDKATPK